jgi:hypothetical protein
MEAAAAPARSVEPRHGLVAAIVLFALYGGLALSVDFPRTALGIQSDEATYYMMAHSLAADGDLAYRREDLARVFREFPTGPSGLFLKKGRDVVDWGLTWRPPFFWTRGQADPDPARLFYGKSFAYPLVAAPFVKLFGTSGFLVLNALLLSLVLLAGYLFLNARSRPAVALLLAGAFVMASVAPVYVVWITPELFNLAIVVLAYFAWIYKEVAAPGEAPPGTRWLLRPWSDHLAAILLGVATFSKPSNALLVLPILAWQAWRGRWTRAVVSSAVFVVVGLGLFVANTAVTGEWNYQGGERATYYPDRPYPFQTPDAGFDVGQERGRDEALADVIFDRNVFWTNLFANLRYFFVGRYSGLVAYFFPAVFAMAAFAIARRRAPWQWLVLAAGVAQILLFVISVPYTYFGGGGSVGNRYFMGPYGVFLFLLPPVGRVGWAVVPWVVGGLFTAQLTLNPFYFSVHPGRYADAGPLRLLPVELTNVNDWPINTERSVRVIWYGDNPGVGDPGFQIYYLDRNAYLREEDKSFWVRGASRAEFLIKTDRHDVRRLSLTLRTGAAASEVAVTAVGKTQVFDLGPDQTQHVLVALDEGFPYLGRRVWVVSVAATGGFVPIFTDPGSTDTRHLGVNVKPMLVP